MRRGGKQYFLGVALLSVLVVLVASPARADVSFNSALGAAEYGDLYVHRVFEPDDEAAVRILPGYFTHTAIKSTNAAGEWLDARGHLRWSPPLNECIDGLFGGLKKTANPSIYINDDEGITFAHGHEYPGLATKAVFHITKLGAFVKQYAANYAYDWFYSRYSYGSMNGAKRVSSFVANCSVRSDQRYYSSYDWGWTNTSPGEHPACSTMIYWAYQRDNQDVDCGQTYYGGGRTTLPRKDYTRQVSWGCDYLIEQYENTSGSDLCELNHLGVAAHMFGWAQGNQGEGDGQFTNDQKVLDRCAAIKSDPNNQGFLNVSATDLVEDHVDRGFTNGYFTYFRTYLFGTGYNMGIEVDVDRPGGDHHHVVMDDPDPDTCAEQCWNSSICWAYTYTPPNYFGSGTKARCYLKSHIPNSVAKVGSGLVSGIKQPGTSPARRQGTIIYETQMSQTGTAPGAIIGGKNGLEDCKDRCSSHATCLSYAFEAGVGTCRLFKDPGTNDTTQTGWVSGRLDGRLSVTAPQISGLDASVNYGQPVTLKATTEFMSLPTNVYVYWKSDVDGFLGAAHALRGGTWTLDYTFATPGPRLVTAYLAHNGVEYMEPGRPSSRTFKLTAYNGPPTAAILSPTSGAQVIDGSWFGADSSASDPNQTIACTQRSWEVCTEGRMSPVCSTPKTGCSTFLSTSGLHKWHWINLAVADDHGVTAFVPRIWVYAASNSAPSISISSPALDAELWPNSTYTLSGSASDPDGIEGYSWYVFDGTNQQYIGAGATRTWKPSTHFGFSCHTRILWLRLYVKDLLGNSGVRSRRVYLTPNGPC